MEEENSITIEKLLKSVAGHKASDLHLVVGSEPQIRKDGELKAINIPPLTKEDIAEMAYSILDEKQKKKFEEENELDFAIYLKNAGRFRGNFYKTLDSIACAFRIIPTKTPSLNDFNYPSVFKELVKKEKGLILVTGPTGSGKSTTLAAMLNEINENERKHIITIEDPVEFVHENKKSLFSQREVGQDTKSFATALKYSLRQDPDVILIGEMRDEETIGAALTAAETGHLVFATLHTNSAPGTINRIIDVFDSRKQPQIRAQLATSLVAVISQTLIPRNGGGLVSAFEVMISNAAIANLIREDKVHQLYSQMQLNQTATKMQTQTQVLLEYLRKNVISKENALRYSNRPSELLKVIEGI